MSKKTKQHEDQSQNLRQHLLQIVGARVECKMAIEQLERTKKKLQKQVARWTAKATKAIDTQERERLARLVAEAETEVAVLNSTLTELKQLQSQLEKQLPGQ